MRIYVPATTTILRALVDDRVLGPAPVTAFAVTPALREWYVDSDAEELEYAAMVEAARASLRLLDADPFAARRRAVVAAEVPDTAVTVRDDLDRGVVHVTVEVAIGQVASVHVDDPDAKAVVSIAAQSIMSADLGDPAAQERVDDAEGFDLSWYASQEIDALLELG